MKNERWNFMKFFKKCLSVLMATAIIITPLIPSKVFADSIHDVPIIDSIQGGITAGVYYDSLIPTSTKSVAIGIDTTIFAELDQSILSEVGNLVNSEYLFAFSDCLHHQNEVRKKM